MAARLCWGLMACASSGTGVPKAHAVASAVRAAKEAVSGGLIAAIQERVTQVAEPVSQ